jgi:hypothetical protein
MSVPASGKRPRVLICLARDAGSGTEIHDLIVQLGLNDVRLAPK